jgi:cyclic pyranopterin phosphate synthase
MTYLNPNQAKVEEITAKSAPRKVANDGKVLDQFQREAKLLSHFDRIVEWKTKGTTYPILVGIDPTFKCNHRCPHCSGLMGQDLSTIPLAKLDPLLKELASLGVKAINLGSGGDPSCHPDLAGILDRVYEYGLDCGYYTNGELLKEKTIEATVRACSWVRFSLDADGPEIHQLIHKASPKAFDKVVKNMHRLQAARLRMNPEMVLGAGYLVRPDTTKGIYNAAKLVRDIGWDYIRFRPFFGYDNQPLCNQEEANEILSELERCKELETDTFKINCPQNRMDWVETGVPPITYARCNVHHFMTQIGGDLKVYLCCHTMGWERYCLGDLNTQTFEEIWNSEKRKQIYENIDYRDCATPCSLNAYNDLLGKFESRTVHPNFL